MGEYFPENKVYVSFYKEWIRSNTDKNYSLEELLNNKESEWHSAGWFDVCIPYKKQDDKELLKSINEMMGYMSERNVSGFFDVDIIYKNYDSISNNDLKYELGEYGKDFVNYDYFIDKYGKYDIFDEETEVRTHGTK